MAAQQWVVTAEVGEADDFAGRRVTFTLECGGATIVVDCLDDTTRERWAALLEPPGWEIEFLDDRQAGGGLALVRTDADTATFIVGAGDGDEASITVRVPLDACRRAFEQVRDSA